MATDDEKKEKASFFVPENARVERAEEHLSPSGKYKLVVTPYSTTNGGWDYSRGVVSIAGSVVTRSASRPLGAVLAEVLRNYGMFPFTFVEGHGNGHDYLICGEDYQGQTVVELDTSSDAVAFGAASPDAVAFGAASPDAVAFGAASPDAVAFGAASKRVDHLPEEAEAGAAFCWEEARFDASSKMLLVCGCHWACPYEFRFYDFSDPMAGWPEIEADGCVFADRKWPIVESGGIVKCYQTKSTDDGDGDGDEISGAEGDRVGGDDLVESIMTFKREGQKLVLQSEWVSDEEKARRAAREEGKRKYEAWKAEFRSTDPLYLTYVELIKDPALSPEEHESIGVTHESWCPHFSGDERRWCRRLLNGDRGNEKRQHTVDLEWAVISGPVKLVVFKDGEHVEDKFFEHSVDGMKEAFAHAKSL